jgi:hypothetical protein
MMGLSPNQILLGYNIALNPTDMPPTTVELAKECCHVMMEWQAQVIKALNQAAEKLGRPEVQYTMGTQV